MLCSIYIEALLVNDYLADRVWQVWNAGGIGDVAAAIAWLEILRLSSSER